MLQKFLIAFAAGAFGGLSNVVFLIIAASIGIPALFGLSLPNFATNAFLYKQVFWGGLWGLFFLIPFMPRNWIARALIVSAAAACVTLFIFFPMASNDGKGPGLAGLNIGIMMPVYVLMADLVFGFIASKLYKLARV